MEVDLLVFEAAPQSLDKDVVHPAAVAVDADRDLVPFQRAGEVIAGERAALVGIEDRGPAIIKERFLERLDAKIAASATFALNAALCFLRVPFTSCPRAIGAF